MVITINNIPFKDETKPFCIECLARKQHRLPFPICNSRAKETGELIPGDLYGPSELNSLGGSEKHNQTPEDNVEHQNNNGLKDAEDILQDKDDKTSEILDEEEDADSYRRIGK
ncbi:hypothetical protein WA026_020691 [Henosepilachna vigintioctopunctata]|uniref:Uncharacterized protein n=1 Tax=Henosepilachna vigintioctopunctata TaxID=420089 RepID=A0AAW1UBG7_9CUCU